MSKSRGRRGLSVEDLVREVEAGKKAPFYLLHGVEEFEREETCTWLVGKLAPETARDFNQNLFRAENLAIQDFLQVYSAYPMMASHRILLLKGCEKLSSDHCKRLEEVIDAPLDTTVLIVVGEKVDMRRRFFQQLAKLGRAVEFRTPYDNQIPQWLQRYARKKRLAIDPEAIDLLRLLVGNSLRELAGEIGKLQTYVGEGQRITRAAVEEVVGASRNASIFEFTDAIGNRNRAEALVMLRQLVEQGEETHRAVAMICRHFQILLKVQDLMAHSTPRDKMAGELGISPYFLKSYMEQARHYPNHSLWTGLRLLLDADSRLKSQGRRQEMLVMELLVNRLCA